MYYSKKDIVNALKCSGIKRNDTVFFTTSIGMLGVPIVKGKITMDKVCKILLEGIKETIGNYGTILIPTYSYSFGKKFNKKLPTFNIKKDISKIGPFGNFFIKEKKVIRSEDPMVSIAGLGPKAKTILNNLAPTSYGKDCVFERILKIKNAKCCSVGLGYNWMPFIHYCDWLNNSPFRFDKYFKGFIHNGKKKKKVVWHYPVRYLRKETIANGHKIGKLANEKKIFKYCKLGRSRVYTADYKKYFRFSMKIIKKNPWMTINGPKFKVINKYYNINNND